MNTVIIGKQGEDLAVDYLTNKGYKIIDRNFRIRGGEIDIIAIDGNTLVYIEVKTRSSNLFGLPEESVGRRKIEFLKRAAKFYRNQNNNLLEAVRIDVVAIDLAKPQPILRHTKNITL